MRNKLTYNDSDLDINLQPLFTLAPRSILRCPISIIKEIAYIAPLINYYSKINNIVYNTSKNKLWNDLSKQAHSASPRKRKITPAIINKTLYDYISILESNYI